MVVKVLMCTCVVLNCYRNVTPWQRLSSCGFKLNNCAVYAWNLCLDYKMIIYFVTWEKACQKMWTRLSSTINVLAVHVFKLKHTIENCAIVSFLKKNIKHKKGDLSVYWQKMWSLVKKLWILLTITYLPMSLPDFLTTIKFHYFFDNALRTTNILVYNVWNTNTLQNTCMQTYGERLWWRSR